MGKKKSNVAVDASLTLAGLTEQYAKHMEREEKSGGTIWSYTNELKLAQAELGAETLVSALTAEDIARFNRSKRVCKLKSGKAKSQLSIDKSRRVLRLSLAWAEQSGLIAASPIPAKGEPTSAEVATAAPAKTAAKTRKAKLVEVAVSLEEPSNAVVEVPVEISAA